jgi:regulatory protein
MQITRLAAQKKNTERVNLYVDDKFFCGLLIDDVVKNNITVGMTVDQEFLSKLLGAKGENDLYNRALVYIMKMPRTESEIKRYLTFRKKCSTDLADRIVERLKGMNYINDEAYAKMFTAAKHHRASVRAIKQKLRQKGVTEQAVAIATAEVDNQETLCASVAEKYMRHRDYDQRNFGRLYRFLVQRGFEYDTVNKILDDFKSKLKPATELFDEFISAREQLRDAKKNYKSVMKRIEKGER